ATRIRRIALRTAGEDARGFLVVTGIRQQGRISRAQADAVRLPREGRDIGGPRRGLVAALHGEVRAPGVRIAAVEALDRLARGAFGERLVVELPGKLADREPDTLLATESLCGRKTCEYARREVRVFSTEQGLGNESPGIRATSPGQHREVIERGILVTRAERNPGTCLHDTGQVRGELLPTCKTRARQLPILHRDREPGRLFGDGGVGR